VTQSPFDFFRRRVRASSRNALELMRLGRLGEAYGAPYEVVDQGEHHRLRRYATTEAEGAPPALLVPPLMVTSEVYDVSSDTSAVTALGGLGIQPFVVDFGAPERESGGMLRTLDDHIRAVLRCIDRVRAITGRDVHMCGYSQGGMFAYQAAAARRSDGIRSLITFGSPVDIHRGLPAPSEITGALVRAVEPATNWLLDRIEGLPGTLTSTAFKMLSPRKELEARVEFVRKLHDRNALVRREGRRRFLGGEGFVAWPGPALRIFFEEFIVKNRMLTGGFVIDGRTVSLADLTCPILAFVGESDEIARPESVRAIALAAPLAPVEFVKIRAGHFGLVVGSRAMKTTWPTVAQWIHFHEGTGPRPEALVTDAAPETDDLEGGDFDIEIELLFDTLARTFRSGVRRLGDVFASTSDAMNAVRYQEPRLRRLAELGPATKISPSLELARRAAEHPDATFFLWHDRAFSYRAADVRVTNVARGLFACGVRPGDRVAVIMGSRPSFLSMVSALSRLGAVAVVVPPDANPEEVRRALESLAVKHYTAEPESAAAWHDALGKLVLVLGGGGGDRKLAPGLVDMEAIDPNAVSVPSSIALDAGIARDLSMVLLRPSDSGELRAARITNHRWALSALGAGAACTLKPDDTVLSCVPLHHPSGILVSVGAALVAGSRLALAESFAPSTFFTSARRVGATVVFYAGEMLRALLFERPGPGDHTLPIRLFAGSGMRADLAARLKERFGVGVMEFYAGTAQKVILANATGEKPGALGHLLPGSADVAIVRYDVGARKPIRGADGFLVLASRGEPGLLAARVGPDEEIDPKAGLVEGAFMNGDRWSVLHDVVREDEDGDYWFVDSLAGFVITKSGKAVSTRKVEDALYALPEIELAAVVGVRGELVAAFVAREGVDEVRIAEALQKLADYERPSKVRQVPSIPLTDGFRPRKREVALAVEQGRPPPPPSRPAVRRV
jgi:putative long chain acyl-CoA synthase